MQNIGTHDAGDSILIEITVKEKQPFQARVPLTEPDRAEVTIFDTEGEPIHDKIDISGNKAGDGEFYHIWHTDKVSEGGETGDFPIKVVFEKRGNREVHYGYITVRQPQAPS